MFGTTRFKWVQGKWDRKGEYLTTDLPISAADADAAAPYFIERGNMLDIDYINSKLIYTTGNAVGILEERVSKDGPNSTQSFYDQAIGKIDLPNVKRGAPASIRVPVPGAMAEFEGLGAAAYDNFVITASTTGFLTATTTLGTELSVQKGGWKEAQVGEFVLAVLEDNDVTQLADLGAGALRIAIRFVSPYKKSA